jgi:Resolvase, N terminal domain
MRTALGYVRVSTDEQAERGLGLEAQGQRIRAYCEMKGLNLTTVFEDPGLSGGKQLGSRSTGGRLLAEARRTHPVVVVARLDRLFRSGTGWFTACARSRQFRDRRGGAPHCFPRQASVRSRRPIGGNSNCRSERSGILRGRTPSLSRSMIGIRPSCRCAADILRPDHGLAGSIESAN